MLDNISKIERSLSNLKVGKSELYFSLLAYESLIIRNSIIFLDKKNEKIVNHKLFEKFQMLNIDKFNIDTVLTFLLEKYSNKKRNGTYYTPSDVTDFMCDFLARKYEVGMSIMDPTAGTGSLLISLIKKIGVSNILLDKIYASDIDFFAIDVLRQRIFSLFLGSDNKDTKNISKIIIKNISVFDVLVKRNLTIDLIISNPPYFEVDKTISKYGNIYAQCVLIFNNMISDRGHLSIIVPISFQSTNRMSILRDDFLKRFGYIGIYSFGDRPDSLFRGVHQKINIVNCSKSGNFVGTSSYLMWRSDNRTDLFKNIKLFPNNNINFKIGSEVQKVIYDKVVSNTQNIDNYVSDIKNSNFLYVSARIAQWSKAQITPQKKGEYITFPISKTINVYSLFAVFNSNTYFNYWSIVSDGWHNTKKIISKFKLTDDILNNKRLIFLGKELEFNLEMNKKYVGSKQIDYVYRHYLSKEIIDKIDSILGKLLGLSEDEIKYIQSFEKGV